MKLNFEDTYSKAREESWTMDNGKPVTIGWIYGYSDYTDRDICINPYPINSLAWSHWRDGSRAKARELFRSIVNHTYDDTTRDYEEDF